MDELKKLKGFKTSPLVSCVVEIRFKHGAGELVPGLVYSAISERYGNPVVENLPVLQLPQQIREKDPNLTFQPTNSIKAKDFTLNVGPRVLALSYDISTKKRYPGWDVFFTELKTLLKELGGIGLFKNVERVGMRYVNFFQSPDFLDGLSITLTTPWGAKMDDDFSFSFLVKNKSSKTRVIVNTNAMLTPNAAVPQEVKHGQILDLDTFAEKMIRYQDLLDVIDSCHADAKSAFTQSLNQSFLESLGPDYV